MHYAPNDVNSNLSMTLTSPVSTNKNPGLPAISTMQSFQSLQSTIIPSVDGVDLAGRLLEWHMKNDNQFPQLSEQLKIGQDGKYRDSKLS